MPNPLKTVINGRTGEAVVVEMSDDEVAEAQAQAAAAEAERLAHIAAEENLDNFTKTMKAFALVVADLHSLTPAQLRDLVRDKRRTLPGPD